MRIHSYYSHEHVVRYVVLFVLHLELHLLFVLQEILREVHRQPLDPLLLLLELLGTRLFSQSLYVPHGPDVVVRNGSEALSIDFSVLSDLAVDLGQKVSIEWVDEVL